MTRLALKIWFVMLAALMVSVFFVGGAVTKTMTHSAMRRVPLFTAGVVSLLQHRLAPLTPAERQAVLPEIQKDFSYPVEIVGSDDPRLSETARQMAKRGRVIARVGPRPMTPIAPLSPDETAREIVRRHKTVAFVGGEPVITLAPLDASHFLLLGPVPPPRVGYWWLWLLLISGVLAIVGLSALFVARPIVQRLQRLADAASRLAAGELEARAPVPHHPRDPVDELAWTFNDMADRVQRELEGQRHLLRAVSHELRTPNARVRFGLELLLDATDAEDRRRRAQSIDDDLQELDELVEELLLYTRFDSDAPDLHPVDFELLPAVQEVLAQNQQLFGCVVFTVDACGDPRISADRRHFKRAISNLLRNAGRYAASEVRVVIRSSDGRVVVEVNDDGPGIPIAERARIFEPFARVDSSRSRSSGGVGLGLAIVKRILDWHDGRVWVDRSLSGGARFSTSWLAA